MDAAFYKERARHPEYFTARPIPSIKMVRRGFRGNYDAMATPHAGRPFHRTHRALFRQWKRSRKGRFHRGPNQRVNQVIDAASASVIARWSRHHCDPNERDSSCRKLLLIDEAQGVAVRLLREPIVRCNAGLKNVGTRGSRTDTSGPDDEPYPRRTRRAAYRSWSKLLLVPRFTVVAAQVHELAICDLPYLFRSPACTSR